MQGLPTKESTGAAGRELAVTVAWAVEEQVLPRSVTVRETL